jgi:hypothetical protein
MHAVPGTASAPGMAAANGTGSANGIGPAGAAYASGAAGVADPGASSRYTIAPTQTEPNGHHMAGNSLVDELERLTRLREAGALTDAEFQAAKARLLG